jgi:hypothetical protein
MGIRGIGEDFNPSQPLTIPFGYGVKLTGSKVE